MNAGKLRHRVIIETCSEAPNEMNELVPSWGTLATVWADIRPVAGREAMRAQQIAADANYVIEIRYYPGLTVKERIKYGARTFEINAIQNPEERNISLLLFCKEAA